MMVIATEIIAVLHIYSANLMDNYYKLAKNNDSLPIIMCIIFY